MRNVDEIRLPKEGQEPEVYAKFLQDIEGDAVGWDRGKGRISWIQGKALNMARESCKRSRKKGAWKTFLASIHMNPSTAKHLRKVAERIDEADSFTMGYSEMLRVVYPSYRAQLEKDADSEDASGGKGKGKSNPTEKSEVDVVERLVTDLTNAKTALQTMKESMPSKRPLTATIQNVGLAITEAKEIRHDAERVLQVLTAWQTTLTGNARVAA